MLGILAVLILFAVFLPSRSAQRTDPNTTVRTQLPDTTSTATRPLSTSTARAAVTTSSRLLPQTSASARPLATTTTVYEFCWGGQCFDCGAEWDNGDVAYDVWSLEYEDDISSDMPYEDWAAEWVPEFCPICGSTNIELFWEQY
jgi:hypothetical protein